MPDLGLKAIRRLEDPDEDTVMMDFYRYGLPTMDHTNPVQIQAMMNRFPGMADRNKKYKKFKSDKEREAVKKSSGEILEAVKKGDTHKILKAIDKNSIVIAATGDPSITPEAMRAIAYQNPSLFYEMIKGAHKASGGEVD